MKDLEGLVNGPKGLVKAPQGLVNADRSVKRTDHCIKHTDVIQTVIQTVVIYSTDVQTVQN